LLTQRIGLAEGDIASGGTGVTDGSDAAAGIIGEFMSASGSGGLTSAAPADRATLTLTAGDWDVARSATITPNIANMTFAQAWLNTAANTPADPGRAGLQPGGAGTLGAADFVIGPRRFSVTRTQRCISGARLISRWHSGVGRRVHSGEANALDAVRADCLGRDTVPVLLQLNRAAHLWDRNPERRL
jgi:hypothetical protein